MYRVLTILSLVSMMLFAACSKPDTPTPSTTTNIPAAASVSPSVTPSVMSSVAPSVATSSSSVAPTVVPTVVIPPAPPLPANGKQATAQQKPLPPDLWNRMTRPLSLEEINRLPPEVRDTILRAQGRLPASPSPAPKKK